MAEKRSDIEAYLPLKPAVVHILLAISGGASHGYGVIQSVREQTEGRPPLSNGAFYRHLSWLLERGLVAEVERPPRDADPRRGTHYRITELGDRVLSAEGGRMREVLAAIESKASPTDERIA